MKTNRAFEVVKKIISDIQMTCYASFGWEKLVQDAIDEETEELRERLRVMRANRNDYEDRLHAIYDECCGPTNASHEYDATPTAEERLRTIKQFANITRWKVLIDKGRRLAGTSVTPPLHSQEQVKRDIQDQTGWSNPCGETPFKSVSLNLGDDCPIKPPTLEQAWQWYVEDIEGERPVDVHAVWPSSTDIPEWFKTKYELDLKRGFPSNV
jgi:hypothetical protein